MSLRAPYPRPHQLSASNPIRHRLSPLLSCLCLLACVPNPKPRIRPCVAGDTATASGPLVIEPSQVPGLTIDSAGWETLAQTFDIGAETIVIFAVRLRTTMPIAIDSALLVYTLRSPRGDSVTILADSIFGPPNYTARVVSDIYVPRFHAVMPPDTVFGAERTNTLESGWMTSSKLRASCPLSVRVIPRQAFRAPGPHGVQLLPIR